MNQKKLFPPEIRTMSVVPRWSIVNTLTRDNLSNHSYFVAIYAYSLAKLIRWDGHTGDLLFRALAHDAEETIIGDIPGPVKNEIIDSTRASEYLKIKMRERLGFIVEELEEISAASSETGEDDEAWRIIKCADRLDALIFMITEKRLGNGVIGPHTPLSWSKTEAAFRSLPAPADELDRLWNTVMVPAIKQHEQEGSMGIND